MIVYIKYEGGVVERRNFKESSKIKNPSEFASQFGAVVSNEFDYNEYLKGVDDSNKNTVKKNKKVKDDLEKGMIGIFKKILDEDDAVELTKLISNVNSNTRSIS